jgi:hypothetical protein
MRCRKDGIEAIARAKAERDIMSITPYLDGFIVDAEARRVLGVALEMTRLALGVTDEFANGVIAKQIIEFARTGERNPNLLCEGALDKLRAHLFGD